jgi:CubicO group peptidase (beta-lactamase class C family)
MNALTRREFLQLSAVAGVGLAVAACQPVMPVAEHAPAGAVTTQLSDELIRALEDKATATLSENGVPGMSVGIIRDDELIYAKGFGVRNIETEIPMTPRWVGSMASISKAFTACAIMQLIEADKLDVDARLIEYVPYFRMADERYKEITIRQMLGHISGMPPLLPEDFYAEWAYPAYDDAAAERLVASLETQKLVGAPGEKFEYSDIGYDTLATVIANVSGEIFEEYIQNHLFMPLGMHDSTFLFEEVDPELLVAAHCRPSVDEAVTFCPDFPYDRKHAPSSCLHTNLYDFSRWLRAHMKGGELEGKRILHKTSQAMLWQPLSTPGWGSLIQNYGWGWWLGDLNGRRSVSSIGGQPGVQTIGLIVPDANMAVIALGNYFSGGDEPFYAMDFATWLMEKLLAT